MDHVTVQFEGICTHITYPYPPLGWPHRVVLPKSWGALAEHYAQLVIPVNAVESEADIHAFASGPLKYLGVQENCYLIGLAGVALTIANPAPDSPYLLERTFLCAVPRLSQVAQQWFGAPDYAVVEDGQIEETWAYFNVAHGTFSAGIVHEGSVAAQLNCATAGAPVLDARKFGAAEGESQRLTLRPGTIMALQYIANENQDTEGDFAIHYHVVRPDLRPLTPLTPPSVPPCDIPRLPCLVLAAIGPGCSNSLFP